MDNESLAHLADVRKIGQKRADHKKVFSARIQMARRRTFNLKSASGKARGAKPYGAKCYALYYVHALLVADLPGDVPGYKPRSHPTSQ